jgi:hypothetical protein
MKKYLILCLSLCFSFFTYGQQDVDVTGGESLIPEHPVTTVSFDSEIIHFGTVTSGDQVKVVYTIFNTGEKPLYVYDAKGSCGCTVPEYPLEPIMPGESGTITAIFDTKGKSGEQQKRVTITANTEPVQTYLVLTGFVTEKTLIPDVKQPERVKPVIQDHLVKIYPNPTNDVLHITYSDEVTRNFTILNTEGKIMKKGEISSGMETIDVSGLSSGTYNFYIQYDGQSGYARPFIVQK